VVVAEDDRETLRRELFDTDLLLHILTPVTAAMLENAPQLKLIQKLGVGVNTIDLDAAKARSVAVCNMPGSNSQAVAEMTLSLMLAVLRRTAFLDRQMRAGLGWSVDPLIYDTVGEIAGRTVGFFGYGAVPARLGPVLEALGAEVIYTATCAKPENPEAFRDFDRLLTDSDVLSLHAPLTERTRGLIDEAAFARMRPGAVLVNTARGELVDEDALIRVLVDGRLRGAGLDVFTREPMAPDHPLLALETVVLSPHAAWLTPETFARCLSIALDNAQRLRRDAPLLHRVV
jgi:phosphoglycerate dehydrogenase-like enzyme